MTITSAQQAAAAAVQISQQVGNVKRAMAQVASTLANGAAANPQAGLPGFSASDLATAIGTTEIANLQAAAAAVAAL